MINEKEFDGYRISFCPKCKKIFKYFFKNDEKSSICPICGKATKEFKKVANGKYKGNRFLPSVTTEKSYFNY